MVLRGVGKRALAGVGYLAARKSAARYPSGANHMQIIFPNAGITPIRCDGRRRPLATLSARLPELP